MMQNAALLWHVSLLVPPERKGLALGMVGLVRVVPIVVFSMISGVRGRRLGPPAADAGHAGRRRPSWRRRWPCSTFRGLTDRLADLRAGGARRRRRRVRPAGAQALVPTLVPREHLPNAISLNTIMFQTASVVGPALGGLLIAHAGVGWVYVANAISFGVRHRRAADDARRAGAAAVRAGHRATTCRCARRSKGCASSSARR